MSVTCQVWQRGWFIRVALELSIFKIKTLTGAGETAAWGIWIPVGNPFHFQSHRNYSDCVEQSGYWEVIVTNTQVCNHICWSALPVKYLTPFPRKYWLHHSQCKHTEKHRYLYCLHPLVQIREYFYCSWLSKMGMHTQWTISVCHKKHQLHNDLISLNPYAIHLEV